MAKVSGPLFSMEASGAYGGVIVFGKRKGANVVRQLVIPSNPMTAGQETSKNRVRVGGVLQKWANATTSKLSGQTKKDSELLTAAAPSNNTWNGYLVQLIVGAQGLTYQAAQTAYAALTAPQKSAWDSAAAALSPPIPDVAQTEAGGTGTDVLTKGEAFFIYQYGLATIGPWTTPGAVPPTYA